MLRILVLNSYPDPLPLSEILYPPLMVHTCDGAFQRCCDASKSHVMYCDRKFNMLDIWLPIFKYLSKLSSDFQTVFSILMDIW